MVLQAMQMYRQTSKKLHLWAAMMIWWLLAAMTAVCTYTRQQLAKLSGSCKLMKTLPTVFRCSSLRNKRQ